MISEFHLRAWNRIPEVEIVALGNRTIEKANERRAQFAPHARTYCDLAAMLAEESLDFVDILTAPAVHYEQCLLACQAGVHIVCQKPLCNRLSDAWCLARRVRNYPRVFAVHENHRYRPWFQEVRRLLCEDFFGKPYFFRLEQFDAQEPPEAYKSEAAEGVLLEYGSHLVDMVRSALGEPLRVYARTHHGNRRIRGESLVHVVYEYPAATAIVDTGWKGGSIAQGSALLLGDRAEAYYEGSMTRGHSARLRFSVGPEIVEDEYLDPCEQYSESFYFLQREFIDAILGRARVTQTVEEHLRTLECTFAAYEAAERGCVVQSNDFGATLEGNSEANERNHRT
jgi:predicted dehydrogenase